MDNVIAFPEMRLLLARDEHLNAIAELVNLCWHQTYAARLPAELTRQRSESEFARQLAPRLASGAVALQGLRVVGYADRMGNCIDNLWVAPDARRKGYGRRLVLEQMRQLRAIGIQSVQAGCEAFNEPALAFFQALGWSELQRSLERISAELQVEVVVFSASIEEQLARHGVVADATE